MGNVKMTCIPLNARFNFTQTMLQFLFCISTFLLLKARFKKFLVILSEPQELCLNTDNQ
jgi:hypothetical protein